jgi:RNA polymerase subunit RPABC4/transcription elongation factor Spt4
MSQLVTCPDCHRGVSPQARACPQCGRLLRVAGERWRVALEWTGAAIVFALPAAFLLGWADIDRAWWAAAFVAGFAVFGLARWWGVR